MNADGSNPRQLTFGGTTDWLDWSSDAKEIVYVSYRADDWTYANGTIWIVNVETGQKRQLAFNYPPSQQRYIEEVMRYEILCNDLDFALDVERLQRQRQSCQR